jgi:hypothetical protein
MRRSVRGLVAVLVVTLMSGVIAAAVSAQPNEAEITAMYEFHEQLLDEVTGAQDRLTVYNEYINGDRWHVAPTLDAGPVAVELERLPDYATAAEYFRANPGLLDELNDGRLHLGHRAPHGRGPHPRCRQAG